MALESVFVSYIVLCGSSQANLSKYVSDYVKRHSPSYRVELVGGVSMAFEQLSGFEYCQAIARYEKSN